MYQNQLEQICFGDKSNQKLTKMFERLSGSDQYRPEYDTLRKEISKQEGHMKKKSE